MKECLDDIRSSCFVADPIEILGQFIPEAFVDALAPRFDLWDLQNWECHFLDDLARLSQSARARHKSEVSPRGSSGTAAKRIIEETLSSAMKDLSTDILTGFAVKLAQWRSLEHSRQETRADGDDGDGQDQMEYSMAQITPQISEKDGRSVPSDQMIYFEEDIESVRTRSTSSQVSRRSSKRKRISFGSRSFKPHSKRRKGKNGGSLPTKSGSSSDYPDGIDEQDIDAVDELLHNDEIDEEELRAEVEAQIEFERLAEEQGLERERLIEMEILEGQRVASEEGKKRRAENKRTGRGWQAKKAANIRTKHAPAKHRIDTELRAAIDEQPDQEDEAGQPQKQEQITPTSPSSPSSAPSKKFKSPRPLDLRHRSKITTDIKSSPTSSS